MQLHHMFCDFILADFVYLCGIFSHLQSGLYYFLLYVLHRIFYVQTFVHDLHQHGPTGQVPSLASSFYSIKVQKQTASSFLMKLMLFFLHLHCFHQYEKPHTELFHFEK